MTRRHQHHSRVVTSFVRIPEPLADGKVRCLCGKAVSLTPNGHLRKHRTPKGDPCSHWSSYRKVVLDQIPDVHIPAVSRPPQAKPRPRPARPDGKYQRLSPTGLCHSCDRPVSGDRTFCGPCLARRSA